MAAIKAAHTLKWKRAIEKAIRTARWAVTMSKVGIRSARSKPPWQFVTFYGPSGGESTGVVDLLAIRKSQRKPGHGMKRGDALHIILIQVKGGSAARPTAEDGRRLRLVKKWHHARRGTARIVG
jgi:hypothetical protein